MIYIIRVLLNRDKKNDDIYRDIKIQSTHHLKDLHEAIKRAFSIQGEELASFYYIDENWKPKKEILLEELSEDEDFTLMVDVFIKEAFPDKGSKMLYIYDFLNQNVFHLEVLDIEDKKVSVFSPHTIKRQGNLPLKLQETKDDIADIEKEDFFEQEIIYDPSEFEQDEDDDEFGFNKDDDDNDEDYSKL